ncbi:hypothetical protein HAX54_027465, partial [Datura stramonium]|nr:hypothetical protein [Datura stramonium]
EKFAKQHIEWRGAQAKEHMAWRDEQALVPQEWPQHVEEKGATSATSHGPF